MTCAGWISRRPADVPARSSSASPANSMPSSSAGPRPASSIATTAPSDRRAACARCCALRRAASTASPRSCSTSGARSRSEYSGPANRSMPSSTAIAITFAAWAGAHSAATTHDAGEARCTFLHRWFVMAIERHLTGAHVALGVDGRAQLRHDALHPSAATRERLAPIRVDLHNQRSQHRHVRRDVATTAGPVSPIT